MSASKPSSASVKPAGWSSCLFGLCLRYSSFASFPELCICVSSLFMGGLNIIANVDDGNGVCVVRGVSLPCLMHVMEMYGPGWSAMEGEACIGLHCLQFWNTLCRLGGYAQAYWQP